jgi:hypothetical protein
LGGPKRIPCASAKPGLSYKETLKEPQIHQMATPEYGKTHMESWKLEMIK